MVYAERATDDETRRRFGNREDDGTGVEDPGQRPLAPGPQLPATRRRAPVRGRSGHGAEG